MTIGLRPRRRTPYGAPAVLSELAADQIERLDAVGTLVDHGDARIAHELLHAVLADIAVAAKHLLRRNGVGKAGVGQNAFDDRRQQAHQVVGGLPRLVVAGAMRDVAVERDPQHSARAASLNARIDISMRRISGCTMIGSAGLSGTFAPGQRAALQAVLARRSTAF